MPEYPETSWLLLFVDKRQAEKSGSYPTVFSETSERKGHTYILEPPTPELGVFLAKTTPKVSARPHPKGHRVLKSKKSDLFKKWEKNKNFDAILVSILRILLGRRCKNRHTFCDKKFFYHPVSVH